MRLVFVGYIRRGGVRVMLINVTVTAYLVGFPYGLRCQRGLKKENQRRNIGGINRGFVFWGCLSVVIHGIGNGEIPYGVRKGHRGGTSICMQSRQQFYFLQVIDMGMKRTCRGEFQQGLGKKRPQRVLPAGYETNYLGGNGGV